MRMSAREAYPARTGASSASGMNAGRVSTWLRAVRIHLWTMVLMPWLNATLATEAPGWPHSCTTWALKAVE